MKRRLVVPDDAADPETALVRALASLAGVAEIRMFLRDLCTPAELEVLTDRWRVIPWLQRGVPYREIHDHTGVSVTTIGRVARFLTMGNGGYRLAAERLRCGPAPAPGNPVARKARTRARTSGPAASAAAVAVRGGTALPGKRKLAVGSARR